MIAAIYTEFGGPVEIQNVKDPRVTGHAVVIQVKPTGICRPDWHGWMPHEPDITLPLYAKAGGKVKISLLSEDDLLLQSWETPVARGVNYPVYHAEIMEKSKPAYEKMLNEKKKKEEDEVLRNFAKTASLLRAWYLIEDMYELGTRK